MPYTQETDWPFTAYGFDESQVPDYVLPDPLLKPDGSKVTTAQEWMAHQRARILALLKQYEYGELLPRPDKLSFRLLSRKDDALDGTAIRKEIRITAAMDNGRDLSFDMLLYMPKDAESHPVPAFLGLNFKGNHATSYEDDVAPTGIDKQDGLPEETIMQNRACQERRWCFKETVARGFASATVCYNDIFRDQTGFQDNSVFRLFYDKPDMESIGNTYTVIGAWAWGLSRAMDCLESLPEIRHDAVAVHGHSRLGKTSLWAGAIDQRFAMVISNDSGCGGGALHRRKYGENISQHFQNHLNWGVPCWFINKLDEYLWREEDLPIDQHELLAMAAPRPLAIATATLDLPADPKGEFLAACAASQIYGLFGSQGLPQTEMPAPDVNITGDISFHYRTGKHDQTPQDWAHYWELMDKFTR